MADLIKTVLLTCLAIISCSGTTLNLMTIYVLLFNRGLYEKIASVRWLMLGEAFADTIVCCIGVPDMFGNILVGYAPPYTTVPFLCHINELLGFAMTYVSLWYQTNIALSRVAAVMAPDWYRHRLSRPLGTVLLFIWPWFIGYIEYSIGALAKAYYISPTPGTGTCVPNQYDDSDAASGRLNSYLLGDALLHGWAPMVVGLVCYVTIYWKIFYDKYRVAHRRQQPNLQSTAQRSVRQNESRPSVTWSKKANVISVEEEEMVPVGKLRNISTMAAAVVGGKLAANSPQQLANDSISARATALPTEQNVSTAAVRPDRKKVVVSRARNKERDKKIKLLAISYVVNICLTFPLMGFAWTFNYYAYYSDVVPFFARTLDVVYLMAFPTTPIVYMLVSGDFRRAFKQIFSRCSKVAPQ